MQTRILSESTFIFNRFVINECPGHLKYLICGIPLIGSETQTNILKEI